MGRMIAHIATRGVCLAPLRAVAGTQRYTSLCNEDRSEHSSNVEQRQWHINISFAKKLRVH